MLSGLPGPHPDLNVTVDDRPVRTLHRCCNLRVAKNPFIASGLRFAADLGPDDGCLAVLGVHGRGPVRLAALLPAFYAGSVSSKDGVFIDCGRRVTVRTETAAAPEFDGDPHGFLPAEIEVLGGELKLIGPVDHD